MNHPAVSVIIPTFNRLTLLRQALDSVAAQTLPPHEVVVVDDGSQEDIVAGVEGHPLRPRVVRQSRQGPGAARNRGLAESTGEFIAFLDSDDLWLPRKLERSMAEFARCPDTAILYGPMSPISVDGKPVTGRTKPCHPGWITQPLFCSSFVHVPTIVCRRDVLTEAGGFNPTLPVCEDYELWLRLSVNMPFALMDEPLALRRLHDARLSKERMDRNLFVKARVLRDFFESGLADRWLDPAVARARLARVSYAAARASLKAGRHQQALQLCRQCRHYGHSRLRTAATVFSAMTLSLLKIGKPEVAFTPVGQ